MGWVRLLAIALDAIVLGGSWDSLGIEGVL